jgi:hypothetical protein
MRLKKAIKVLSKSLREDKEFYYGYQSNIAMCFVDEAKKQRTRDSYKKLHNVANEAAKNFLNLLIKEQK